MKPKQRPAVIIARLTGMLLLLSLACSIPGLGPRGNPTPTSPAGSAEPTPPPPDLPPALVETDPLPGSVISLDGAITLYFNQPMQRASVEGALSGEPPLSGSFTWKDDATLTFTPAVHFLPGSTLTINLAATAQSSQGMAMLQPVSLTYSTSPALTLTQRLPDPGAADVDPRSAVVASFNRPVVPLGADPASLPAAFTIEPSAPGQGEWVNTSTYIFYPQPALAGGNVYLVTPNAALTATDGSPLQAADQWAFTTSTPYLMLMEPLDGSAFVHLDTGVRLTFNQAMDPASVAANFSLLDPNGQAVSGQSVWNEDFTTLAFTPTQLLQRGTGYTAHLGADAAALGGATLGVDSQSAFSTASNLSIYATDPAPGGIKNPYQGVALYVTSVVDTATSMDFISITPAVPDLGMYMDEGQHAIYVYGNYAPNTDYTLTVSGALTDLWGSALGSDYTLSFRSAPLDPQVIFPYDTSANFLAPWDAGMRAQAASLSEIPLTTGSLPLSDFITMLGPNGYDLRQSYVPADAVTRFDPVETNSSTLTWVDVPLLPDGRQPTPGLYLMRVEAIATGSGISGYATPLLVAVSNYQTTFKLSNSAAFVWAVDLRTNTPAAGLPVQVLDENGNVIAAGQTDTQGVFSAPITELRDPYANAFAVLGGPGQDNFGLALPSWSSGIDPYSFDIQRINYAPPSRLAYLYSDRPIYRPGDTVYFRGVVRQAANGRYSLPDLASYPLVIFDGVGLQVGGLELGLSAFGTLHGEYQIPAGAQPGTYRIENEQDYSMLTFEVAEYRKPEINLQVALQAEEFLNGDTLEARVEARYFFDAPTGSLPVHWVLYARNADFHLPGGYQVGPLDQSWLNVFNFPFGASGFGESIAQGDGQTGPDGVFSLQLPTEASTSRKLYTLEVTAADESGLPVSARAAAYGNPADFYAGVRPDSWSVQAQAEAGFDVLTADWQRNPSATHSLTALFQKAEWVRQDPPMDQPAYVFPTYELVTTPVASSDFTTGPDGTARLAFTPPEPGTYLLDVSGGGTQTQVLIWAAGAGQAVWPNLPNQRLRLTADQDTYLQTDTAQIFVPNPFPATSLALLTVERGLVMRHQILQVPAGGSNVPLALTDEDVPNVYVSVTLLGQDGEGRSDFRQGYLMLSVTPVIQKLDVQLTSQPERMGPGDQVAFGIRVTDAQGNPVQGEFSISVVDKAVLALADPNSADILTAFYGEQPLSVRTGLSLAASGQRLVFTPGGLGGGGGEAAVSVARENFPDTAFWNAEVLTDANGQATVTVTLPDTLTTWVVLVRGLTADTRVGEATVEVVTTQELLVRPVMPRFLVASDHLQLAAIAQNNTAHDLQASVSLQATGFTLDSQGSALQQISLPAGGRVRVEWWGTVQDQASADLLFAVQAGDLQDAVRVASGALPILRYLAPQTYATSGVLAEGGERLEIVSLPASFDSTSGDLSLELAPSLAAGVLDGLQALEYYPYQCTEQTLSRFLPNLEALRAMQQFGIDAPDLQERLERTYQEGISRLLTSQNQDGGWGWWSGTESDPYLTSYVLFGLVRANLYSPLASQDPITRAVAYLNATLVAPDQTSETWQLDRLAFEDFALAQAQAGNQVLAEQLFAVRDQLSPWARALLALALESMQPGSEPAHTLISDLQSTAARSATGVHWENLTPAWQNMTSSLTTSAMVTYALALRDPASTLLPDAVNYLMSHRQLGGWWGSTYESAWVLMAMTEVMRSSGELGGNFAFGATLNGIQVASGEAAGRPQLTPVLTSLPLSQLYPDNPNALAIQREAGAGRLYYTAALNVYRPVQDAAPVERGISISRSYFPAGLDLRQAQPLSSAQVGDTLTVRLTVVLPQEAYRLIVEDYLPAGTEILNTRLKTTQLGPYGEPGPLFNPDDPYGGGWGWWLFSPALVFDDHIAFTANYLPAGTYQLTYTLAVLQPGEFQVMPARAWLFYFPEVQGVGAGSLFEIRP